MIASDMFKELHYKQVSHSSDFEEVNYLGIGGYGVSEIVFCTDGFIEYRFNNQVISFYHDELLAMIQQCRELGWLE